MKHLVVSVIFKNIKEITPERNHINVKIVKHLGIPESFKNTKWFLALERNHLNLNNVVKPPWDPSSLQTLERTHMGEKHDERKEC